MAGGKSLEKQTFKVSPQRHIMVIRPSLQFVLPHQAIQDPATKGIPCPVAFLRCMLAKWKRGLATLF